MIFSSACGYVGPVQAPSSTIPTAVTNLTAVERGDQIVIAFNTPSHTTDSLAIKRFSVIDLRVGPDMTPFDFELWTATAKEIPVTLPPDSDPLDPQPIPISASISALEWKGRHVTFAVRTAAKNERYSTWSNRATIDVISPLETPSDLKAESTADGVRLTWRGSAKSYRVLRTGPGDKLPIEIGRAEEAKFVDVNAAYDTPYSYVVVASKDPAESLPSNAAAVTPVDKFAPGPPAGITALAGPASIEVSWQRNTEPDLKGFYVYRSVDGGPYEKQGDLVTVPAFSDSKLERGKTYRYAVSAVDKKDNESVRSAEVQAAF